MSKRLHGIRPDPGVFGVVVLRFLQRNDNKSFPVPQLLAACDLDSPAGWHALGRLLQLGLVQRRSRDTIIRIGLTPAGRSFRGGPLPRTPRP